MFKPSAYRENVASGADRRLQYDNLKAFLYQVVCATKSGNTRTGHNHFLVGRGDRHERTRTSSQGDCFESVAAVDMTVHPHVFFLSLSTLGLQGWLIFLNYVLTLNASQ